MGLSQVGLFKLRWQQFLSAAAVIAIVNAVVGGVFIALMLTYLAHPPTLVAIGIGAAATLLVGVAYLRHQWSIIMRVAKALPM